MTLQAKLNSSASGGGAGGLDGGLRPFSPSASGLKCCRERHVSADTTVVHQRTGVCLSARLLRVSSVVTLTAVGKAF